MLNVPIMPHAKNLEIYGAKFASVMGGGGAFGGGYCRVRAGGGFSD